MRMLHCRPNTRGYRKLSMPCTRVNPVEFAHTVNLNYQSKWELAPMYRNMRLCCRLLYILWGFILDEWSNTELFRSSFPTLEFRFYFYCRLGLLSNMPLSFFLAASGVVSDIKALVRVSKCRRRNFYLIIWICCVSQTLAAMKEALLCLLIKMVVVSFSGRKFSEEDYNTALPKTSQGTKLKVAVMSISDYLPLRRETFQVCK